MRNTDRVMEQGRPGMSRLTSIKWDVEYRIDRFKIGQRVEVVPVIETINGMPVSDFPAQIVTDVLNTLYNDDMEFNEAVDKKRIG